MYVFKYKAGSECHNDDIVGCLYWYANPQHALDDGYFVKKERVYLHDHMSRIDFLGNFFTIDPDQRHVWKEI